MTHQAEQPNPAQPYMNMARDYMQGGLARVLRQRGVELPDLINKADAMLQNPDFQLAMGMVSPLQSPLMTVAQRAVPLSKVGEFVPETIKSHAVQVGGKIYQDDTHLGAYNKALRDFAGIDPGGSQRNLFVTSEGRVITHKEAMQLPAVREALGLD
jgi:hypothetical protein